MGVNIMKNMGQKGFSLVELLVVVIIIAIVAAIAIPNLLASRRAANEASAISTLRTYHSAESTYLAMTGNHNTYGAAGDLTGLVDAVLATDPAVKSGYTFTVTAGADGTQLYCVSAAPTTAGSTGVNYYGVSVDGVIYKGASALDCSGGVLTVTGAAPIQ